MSSEVTNVCVQHRVHLQQFVGAHDVAMSRGLQLKC